MRNRNVRILLGLVLMLSVCLVAVTPAVADGDDGRQGASFASGGGKYYYKIAPYNMDGKFQFHMQEATDGQPAKGFLYATNDISGFWLEMEVEEVAVEYRESWWTRSADPPYELEETGPAWGARFWGVVVGSSETFQVGTYYVGGLLDVGTPGRNGDRRLALSPIEDFGLAMLCYESVGKIEPLPLPISFVITEGNIVIKGVAE